MSNDDSTTEGNSRHPDVDLAIAFAGSVLSGTVSGGLAGWSVGWILGEEPNNLIGGFIALGVLLGIPWGFLNLIVTATAEPIQRRKTSIRMFGILGVGLFVVANLIFVSIVYGHRFWKFREAESNFAALAHENCDEGPPRDRFHLNAP